jgi:integrase
MCAQQREGLQQLHLAQRRLVRGRSSNTIETGRILANQHVIPALGARKLSELSAEDVDRWLAEKAQTLSTSTVQRIRSILSRALARAQARDKVKRNVVLPCATPTGKIGRPSKALSLAEAESLLRAAEGSTMGAYVVLSLLTGARTEELRALTWSHVDLDGDAHATPPVPPHIMVWRSVRAGGDTKTRKSRRTLALPLRCISELRAHRTRQAAARHLAGGRRKDNDLVFASEAGTPLDARERPTRLPTDRGRRRAHRRGLDAPRAATQLRLPAVGQRGTHRADLTACRSQRNRGHRARLPQADPTSPRRRRHRHGPHLQPSAGVIIHLVTQPTQATTNGLAGSLKGL